jgi:hypothetical protein
LDPRGLFKACVGYGSFNTRSSFDFRRPDAALLAANLHAVPDKHFVNGHRLSPPFQQDSSRRCSAWAALGASEMFWSAGCLQSRRSYAAVHANGL